MVKISINEIKFNPFKKFINGGKLEEERIDKLVESIEHGTLQPNFIGRKTSDGKYEISSGHHRLGAFKKKFGKDYKVEFMLVNFSDEQMLVDMVRENLTQRGEGDFRDTEESIVLARNWVLKHSVDTKPFGGNLERLKDGRKASPQHQIVPGSAKSIANFLSKNGKAVSHELVRLYLSIHDNLDGNLKKKLENLEGTGSKKIEDKMGVRVAMKLATIKDKAKQREAWEKVNEYQLNSTNAEKFISKFREDNTITPEIITQQQYQEDYEEDEIDRSINFEQHWKRTYKDYQDDLIQWQEACEKIGKINAKKLIAEILDNIEQEKQTVKEISKVVK